MVVMKVGITRHKSELSLALGGDNEANRITMKNGNYYNHII